MLTTEGTENTEAATPETDDQPTINAINDNGYQVPCVDIKFARKLERERDEARAGRDEARFFLKAAQSALDAIHLEVGGWIKIMKENTD